MVSSRRFLQTKGKFFTNFKFVFELMTQKRKIFKRMSRREYCICIYKECDSVVLAFCVCFSVFVLGFA